MILFSKAKINLGLNIVNKRHDGYHDIESILYPIELCDIIEILPSNSFQLTIFGNSLDVNTENNLCFKAFSLMKKHYSINNIRIILYKKIPTGAGLGGGSSNASTIITGINKMFRLNLSTEELSNLAAQIGSDCPFFIYNQPALVRGKGTEIHRVNNINLKNYYCVIVKNNIHISTAWAYSLIKPKIPEQSLSNIIQNTPIESWKNMIKNDFEEVVFNHYEELRQLKNKLYELGAIYASLTGSGSAIFGIFETPPPSNSLNSPFIWIGKFINYADETL